MLDHIPVSRFDIGQMCLRSSVPCTLKDGQKDIITIKSNCRRGNMYRIAARIYSSVWLSASKDHFASIVRRQLCRHGLNISSENSWKNKSSPDQDNSRKSTSVRQLTMFNMESLSTNLKCQPPLAVFIALKVTFANEEQEIGGIVTRLPAQCGLRDILSIEASFARFIGTKARANSDVVCPTNLRHDMFSVASLDNKI